jgi:hypothetical protein
MPNVKEKKKNQTTKLTAKVVATRRQLPVQQRAAWILI